eukprot:jgi/Botrbrau1/20583/Bobra.113_1s0009.1
MNWSRHVRDVLARDGANLTEDVKLDLVKKAAYLHKEVATLLDAHLAGKTLVTVTDFLHEVQQHFKPDPIGYIECIRAKAQKDNQTASSYVKELEDIGLSFWIGYPTSEEQFDVIINTFSKHHYTYIRQQFDVARSTVRRTAGANPITFRDLITWANSSDSAFTTNKMQKNYDRGAGKAAGAQGQNQPGHDNQGKGRRGRKNKDKGQANLGQAANEQGFEEYKSFVCQLDIDCSSEDVEMDCALSELANQHKVQSPSVQVRTPSRADQNVVGFREVILVSRANAPYTPIPKHRARSRVHATLDDAMQEPQVPLVHSTAVHVPIDQDGFIVVNNSKRKRLAVPPLPVSNAKSPSSKALPPSSPHVFPRIGFRWGASSSQFTFINRIDSQEADVLEFKTISKALSVFTNPLAGIGGSQIRKGAAVHKQVLKRAALRVKLVASKRIGSHWWQSGSQGISRLRFLEIHTENAA